MTSTPVLYEIETWIWLQTLSTKYGRRIDLSSVPAAEWDVLGKLDCDAVWLMGVWKRSEEGRRIALADPGLIDECKRILPGFTPDDLPGSPYCVQSYVVDERLGSLGVARTELAQRGLRLILDWVPNHTARDNPWTTLHPGYYIQGSPSDLAAAPNSYFQVNGHVIACGRDPYFPPWTDTAQLNAFSADLRQAAAETLVSLAEQCDGVRCDMAMLMLNDIFSRTWGVAAGPVPATEYWTGLVAAVRKAHPDFLFIAEAYWDLEWNLQQLGFNYCYDKRLYDRLVHGNAGAIRAHLSAPLPYQSKLIRFLENHDEPRAAATMPAPRNKAAAVAVATLPGAILYFAGQFCGDQIHVPVQLGRGPVEPCDAVLEDFYTPLRRLSRTIRDRDSHWQLAGVAGWPDNSSFENLISWSWTGPGGQFLIVINFSGATAQARIQLPWSDLSGKAWTLTNLTGSSEFVRDGSELQTHGLYVALDAWQYYVLRLEKTPAPAPALS